MTETIDLSWIGATLRTIQSEQRSLRTEQDILRKTLSNAITALLDRIGSGEAMIMTRFDRLEVRLDQIERSVEERLDRINGDGGVDAARQGNSPHHFDKEVQCPRTNALSTAT